MRREDIIIEEAHGTAVGEEKSMIVSVRKMALRFICLMVVMLGIGMGSSCAGNGSETVYAYTEDEIMDKLETALANAWDNYSTSLSMSDIGLSGLVTLDMYEEAYTNVIYDNYEYFYLPFETNYSYSGSGSSARVTSATFSYTMSKTEVATALKKLESAISTALSGVDSSWSDLEKVIYVHDYLTRINEYDTTYSNYFIYNALVDNTSVCEGYALTFRYLLRSMGIECELVSSSSLGHMWNAVKVNGKYYMVDVTYDDPFNPDILGQSNHTYFLKSYSYFMSDSEHKASDWEFTGGLTSSSFSSTYYDSYFWNSVTTGFEYVSGTWYGINGTTLYTYTCNGTDFTQKSSLITISAKWKVIGTSSSYWSGSYARLASYEDELYYSTPDAIYVYVPSSGTAAVIYQLSSSASGYIYGMKVVNGVMYYYEATTPNSGGSIGTYKVDVDLPYGDMFVSMSSCTISLSATSYTYNGKEKKPTVTVKYGGKTLTSGTDYTVAYSDNTNAGTATVTITGAGTYTGSVDKTFTIKKASQTVSVSVGSKSIIKGKTTTIKASGEGTITYKSSKTSVATVSSSGKVTGKAYGTTTITIKAAGNSNYKSASTTVKISVKLATPKISSISNTSSGIKLSWGKVSGAVKYQVYRKTSSSGSWSKLGTTTKNSYTDKTAKNGKKYYYAVRCITSGGSSTSALSSKKLYYRLSTPTISSIKNSESKTLTIKYKKNSSATGYQVQYSTKKSFSSVTKTYTISKNSTLSQKITGLKKGKTYYVRVRAYKKVSGTKYYSGWQETSKKVSK